MAFCAVVENDWGDVFREGDWDGDLDGFFLGRFLTSVFCEQETDDENGEDGKRSPEPW